MLDDTVHVDFTSDEMTVLAKVIFLYMQSINTQEMSEQDYEDFMTCKSIATKMKPYAQAKVQKIRETIDRLN